MFIESHALAIPDGQIILVEQSGDNPELGILGGSHGHEFQIIPRLRTAMSRLLINDPSFLGSWVRILDAHPNATKARSRDFNGIDLNRSFPHSISDPQRSIPDISKKLIQEFVKYQNIRLAVSFHGNVPEGTTPSQPFHLYDCTPSYFSPGQENFDKLRLRLFDLIRNDPGFKGDFSSALFTGNDTPDLNNYIKDGYRRQIAEIEDDHTFELWMAASALRNNGFNPVFPLLDRVLVVEVPTLPEPHQQIRLIKLLFSDLIIPQLNFLKTQEFKPNFFSPQSIGRLQI